MTARRSVISGGGGLAIMRSARFNFLRLAGILNFQRGAAWAFAFALLGASASPAYAQQHGGSPHGSQGSGSSEPTTPVAAGPGLSAPGDSTDPFGLFPTPTVTGDTSGDISRIMENEACNTWTESGVRSPTVSSTRLAVPAKAGSEYQKGCSAFKGKKLPEAEDHLRKAIDYYEEYSAAWVVLGQVLNSEEKKDDALAACWKAREMDPGYVASYLCLADVAAGEKDWEKVSDLAKQALGIDPTGNAYSYYYAADGCLHLKELAQAEVYAQAALKIDQWHRMPELHLLLAHIYDSEKNLQGEADQLRQFLKAAPNSKDAPAAKTLLAQVEAQPAQ